MMLMENRRDEIAIRKFQPNLTNKTYQYSKGKKTIEFFFIPFKLLYVVFFLFFFCNYFSIKFLKGYLVTDLKGVPQSKHNFDIIISK